jgi:hypothetical protein
MMAQRRKKGKILSKLLRAAIAALPLAGDRIQHVPLIWPPLGSIETYAAVAAAAIIAAFGALPMFFRTKSQARLTAAISIGLAFSSLFPYGYFLSRYVKRVETLRDGIQYRTIGSQRSAEALQKLPGKSDEEILEIAGLTDGDIERMWTPESVEQVHLELFVSYLACFALVNFAIGAFARGSPDTDSKDG